MPKNLVVLTPEERIEANVRVNDVEGWRSEQSMASWKVRETIQSVAYALKIAARNPDDEDCQKLKAALVAFLK